MRQTTASALLMLAAPMAAADDGTAVWLWSVTTQDGDALVEQGETATVTLTLLMEPPPGVAAALCAAVFDTIGTGGADQGEIVGWEVHSHFADLTGDLTTTDGVSLFNTYAGQLETFGPFNADNPVDVFTFEWAPSEPLNTTVTYTTSTETEGPHDVIVWECSDQGGDITAVYPLTEAEITFDVMTCLADCNGDGVLNILDFVAFQMAWQAGHASADCNLDGAFDILDFICFQGAFVEGCR